MRKHYHRLHLDRLRLRQILLLRPLRPRLLLPHQGLPLRFLLFSIFSLLLICPVITIIIITYIGVDAFSKIVRAYNFSFLFTRMSLIHTTRSMSRDKQTSEPYNSRAEGPIFLCKWLFSLEHVKYFERKNNGRALTRDQQPRHTRAYSPKKSTRRESVVSVARSQERRSTQEEATTTLTDEWRRFRERTRFRTCAEAAAAAAAAPHIHPARRRVVHALHAITTHAHTHTHTFYYKL